MLFSVGVGFLNKSDFYAEYEGSRGNGCSRYQSLSDISESFVLNATVAKLFRISDKINIIPTVEMLYLAGRAEFSEGLYCRNEEEYSQSSLLTLKTFALRIPILFRFQIGQNGMFSEIGMNGLLPFSIAKYTGEGKVYFNNMGIPYPEPIISKVSGEMATKAGLGFSVALGYKLSLRKLQYHIKCVLNKSIGPNLVSSGDYRLGFNTFEINFGFYF